VSLTAAISSSGSRDRRQYEPALAAPPLRLSRGSQPFAGCSHTTTPAWRTSGSLEFAARLSSAADRLDPEKERRRTCEKFLEVERALEKAQMRLAAVRRERNHGARAVFNAQHRVDELDAEHSRLYSILYPPAYGYPF
jgi:hypothetical protein